MPPIVIARAVCRTWKTRNLPWKSVKWVESWKHYNPDWKHVLYTDADMELHMYVT